ncbi:MAG TPA: hypothetical protein VEU30_14125 [Thermoanaerobaculia bacterium]|nr:hypothetical protein [Thermoanaerobaculia bacterium]
MIPLHPTPRFDRPCPRCGAEVAAGGWLIPGMRMLADVRCSGCGMEFHADLAAGHGLYYPVFLEKESGRVHASGIGKWFASLLESSWRARSSERIPIEIERFREVERPLLLNCLDWQYGHALLKLFNAQYHLEHDRDHDLIVLVPKFLRWLVPDGVSEVWTVDLPLRRAAEWNDALAAGLRERLGSFDAAHLSLAVPHPHPADWDVVRFSRVAPFPFDEWHRREPLVTFIWREDRLWSDERAFRMRDRLFFAARHRLASPAAGLDRQARLVEELASEIRTRVPNASFAVAGIGTPRAFSPAIENRIVSSVDTATERAWCELYARSHVVTGIHGSNMILPSAHAGSVIDLMPPARWTNLRQDVETGERDPSLVPLRAIYLATETRPATIADLIRALLLHAPAGALNFDRHWTDHQRLRRDPDALRREKLARTPEPRP